MLRMVGYYQQLSILLKFAKGKERSERRYQERWSDQVSKSHITDIKCSPGARYHKVQPSSRSNHLQIAKSSVVKQV